MINVSFYLRNPKNTRSKIYLACRWCHQQVKWSTGISIATDEWDQSRHEPKRSHPNHLRIKSRLLKIEGIVQDIYFDFQEQESGIISKRTFKEKLALALNKRDHPIVANRSILFFGKNYCEGKRQTLKESFAAFIEFTDGQDVLFEEIDFHFIEGYIDYMKGKGLAVGTINLRLQAISQIIKAAYVRKYHNNPFVITSDLKINSSKYKKPTVALSKNELMSLARLDVPPEMQASKDLFFFGFFTGQRYSDYSRICPEMFSSQVMRLIQKKTRAVVEIPITLLDKLGLPFTFKELLVRYDYTAPEVAYYKFAVDIKEMGRMAGINLPIENVVDSHGKRFVPLDEKTIPKWRRLSSMSCRKTFATILYKAGVNLDNIRVFTGHESVKTLMIYIDVKKEESRQIAQQDVVAKIGRMQLSDISLN